MEKTYLVGAVLGYTLFILLTAWFCMLALGNWSVNVSYQTVVLSIVSLRLLFVLIKGNITDE
jgi:hypothetical protein